MRAAISFQSSYCRRFRFVAPTSFSLRLALNKGDRPFVPRKKNMSFKSLGLSDEIVRAVTERGYTEPTPIQAQAIPVIMKGGDLMGGAQTGTGKTAGFTLPLLQRLMDKNVTGKAPIRALVLTPTRELAAQVEESVREYGKYLPLKSMMMFGGVLRQARHVRGP